jgi:sulfotransferase
LRKYGFLAGLPRTGSTLLTYLLAQNPAIHVSGGSPLARIMVGVHETCNGVAKEGLSRCNRQEFEIELLREIPRLYYQSVQEPFILVKDRAWTHDPLGFLSAFTDQPRIVVMLRSVLEIVRSFVSVGVRNSDILPERGLLLPNDPLFRALRNTMKALESSDERFLFGTYDQLVSNPQVFVEAVYKHYGWDSYSHDFGTVEDLCLENDAAEGTEGLHEVRPTIARRHLSTRVSEGLMRLASEYDEALWEMVRISLRDTPHRHI